MNICDLFNYIEKEYKDFLERPDISELIYDIKISLDKINKKLYNIVSKVKMDKISNCSYKIYDKNCRQCCGQYFTFEVHGNKIGAYCNYCYKFLKWLSKDEIEYLQKFIKNKINSSKEFLKGIDNIYVYHDIKMDIVMLEEDLEILENIGEE